MSVRRQVALPGLNAYAASVSNSDGTLTISPTTGAVIASLNRAHVNAWTGQQYYTSQSLTLSAGTFSWNWGLGRVFTITGSGGTTIACPLPSNYSSGINGHADIIVTNSASGGEYLTFASASYKQLPNITNIVGNASKKIWYHFFSDASGDIFVNGFDIP